MSVGREGGESSDVIKKVLIDAIISEGRGGGLQQLVQLWSLQKQIRLRPHDVNETLRVSLQLQ